MGAELLLHSLAEFRDVILGALEIAGARTVVEIGSEEATFTRELLARVEKSQGTLHCVEPHPAPALQEMQAASPALHLVQARSPGALGEIPASDAYVIDGDHNYATVRAELAAIDRACREAGTEHLLFLHDVGWPWGRRDLYYAPESLPPEWVHPFTYDKGVTLGCDGVVSSGFRGEGHFACALHEGGSANGVLTAVDDFLSERDDLALVKVPCIFGLGVIYSKGSPYATPLRDFLACYDDNGLLERLERNRLSLYLRVLELQDAREESRLHIRDVEAENRALWARTAELEGELQGLSASLDTLRNELDIVVRSRAFALAERLSQVRQGAAHAGPGLSRQRLRQVLDGERRS